MSIRIQMPSQVTKVYWIFAYPTKPKFDQSVLNAVSWFERNAMNYLNSGKMYPLDIFPTI